MSFLKRLRKEKAQRSDSHAAEIHQAQEREAQLLRRAQLLENEARVISRKRPAHWHPGEHA